jgi:hypothetical protein
VDLAPSQNNTPVQFVDPFVQGRGQILYISLSTGARVVEVAFIVSLGHTPLQHGGCTVTSTTLILHPFYPLIAIDFDYQSLHLLRADLGPECRAKLLL